ncbi:MAG: molybdopterin-guanine dinucleotide biosynthesis protein B [Syntrophorhabdaceae bacterium]
MPSKTTIPIIAIIGRANSGKTTLVEKLTGIFTHKGVRVAIIKHMHHEFDFDIPGKDTHRHKEAGASTVISASPGRIGMVKDTSREYSLDDIITRYVSDADLIIVEGFKSAVVPKIEVYSRQSNEPPLCTLGDALIIAVAADDPLDVAIPRFMRDDVNAIADFIASRTIGGTRVSS